MSGLRLKSIQRWAAPLLLFVLGAGLGLLQSEGRLRASEAEKASEKREQTPAQKAPLRASVNTVWALGPASTAKLLIAEEMSELGPEDGERRARLLIRLGLLSSNPTQRSFIYSAACGAHQPFCDGQEEAVKSEKAARFLAETPLESGAGANRQGLPPGHP